MGWEIATERVRGRRGNRGHRPQLSRADLLIERGRFLRRRNPQFVVERLAKELILAQHGGLLPRLGIQSHQLIVGGFVPGIECQPAASVENRLLVAALIAQEANQAFKGGGMRLAQTLGLEQLPLVKLGAVRQGEAGKKITPVKVGRRDQQFGAGVIKRQIALKLGHIQPVSWSQAAVLAIQIQPLVLQGQVELNRFATAECCPSALVTALRPKECSQGAARLPHTPATAK